MELLAAKKFFEVTPEVVAYVCIVMSFVSLKFESLNVPCAEGGWDLRVHVVHVVASHSCEELSLSVATLPLLELPVLPINKNSDHACPPRFSKVSHTVVDVKSDVFIAYSSVDCDHLAS